MKLKTKINFKKWAKVIFPLNRSLSGVGNLETLKLINKFSNRKFKIKFFKTNKKYFDWKIPKVWHIKEAYIRDENNKEICNYKVNNLHVVGYSHPINKKTYFKNVLKHIFFNRNYPKAIPYITSYYKKFWGFCLSFNQFKKLNPKKKYHFLIKSKFTVGKMHYSELLIKGKSKKEILICSYICHPSMANNELSGPLVITALAKILKPSKYSVRLLLIPETIGAVAFISKNLKFLKKNLIAGFNLTCCGDKGNFSIIRSKEENTYSDKIVKRLFPNFKHYSFLSRGSNERQFGCQNLNLPFVTLCRTKFGMYRQYHTSEDNLNFIKEKYLRDTLKKTLKIIKEIQESKIFIKKKFCEPFLTKYNLINSPSQKNLKIKSSKNLSNLIAYSDKNSDEKELSTKLKIKISEVREINKLLVNKKIIEEYL